VSRYKDYLIGIEELVWSAIELGARDEDSIYAYVYQYEPKVDEQTVSNILAKYNDFNDDIGLVVDL
jgi:hypothetical protein